MGAASSVPNNPPSPPTGVPLREVVVNNGNRNAKPPTPSVVPPVQGATAPRDLSPRDPSPIDMSVRREYVALGGSRKVKSRKGKSKAKNSKKAKKTKSRK